MGPVPTSTFPFGARRGSGLQAFFVHPSFAVEMARF